MTPQYTWRCHFICQICYWTGFWKGQQDTGIRKSTQHQSNPQSRAVRAAAFGRHVGWPAQTSSRLTLWRPSALAPPPDTATPCRHALEVPAVRVIVERAKRDGGKKKEGLCSTDKLKDIWVQTVKLGLDGFYSKKKVIFESHCPSFNIYIFFFICFFCKQCKQPLARIGMHIVAHILIIVLAWLTVASSGLSKGVALFRSQGNTS